MLAILIVRDKCSGQIAGVIPHLVNDWAIYLTVFDDTIIFMDDDFEHAKNMILLLSVFEKLSGLKNVTPRCLSTKGLDITPKLKPIGENKF